MKHGYYGAGVNGTRKGRMVYVQLNPGLYLTLPDFHGCLTTKGEGSHWCSVAAIDIPDHRNLL